MGQPDELSLMLYEQCRMDLLVADEQYFHKDLSAHMQVFHEQQRMDHLLHMMFLLNMPILEEDSQPVYMLHKLM